MKLLNSVRFLYLHIFLRGFRLVMGEYFSLILNESTQLSNFFHLTKGYPVAFISICLLGNMHGLSAICQCYSHYIAHTFLKTF